jgi:hypothetical protein
MHGTAWQRSFDATSPMAKYNTGSHWLRITATEDWYQTALTNWGHDTPLKGFRTSSRIGLQSAPCFLSLLTAYFGVGHERKGHVMTANVCFTFLVMDCVYVSFGDGLYIGFPCYRNQVRMDLIALALADDTGDGRGCEVQRRQYKIGWSVGC